VNGVDGIRRRYGAGHPGTSSAGLARDIFESGQCLQMSSEGASYEFRVRGHLGQTMRIAFPELGARLDGDDTLLSGTLPDQAAVYGVLAVIETLGLELIQVRRMTDG
jgi:hypothetical protein